MTVSHSNQLWHYHCCHACMRGKGMLVQKWCWCIPACWMAFRHCVEGAKHNLTLILNLNIRALIRIYTGNGRVLLTWTNTHLNIHHCSLNQCSLQSFIVDVYSFILILNLNIRDLIRICTGNHWVSLTWADTHSNMHHCILNQCSLPWFVVNVHNLTLILNLNIRGLIRIYTGNSRVSLNPSSWTPLQQRQMTSAHFQLHSSEAG